jgi:hypothetical protein
VLAGSKTRKVKVHVCVGQENRYSNPNGENTFQLSDILCSRSIEIRLAVSVFSNLRCIIFERARRYFTKKNSSENTRFYSFYVA